MPAPRPPSPLPLPRLLLVTFLMSEGASSWPQSPGSVGEPRDNLGAGLSFPLRSAERCCPQCPLPPVAKSTKRTLLSGAVGKAPFPHAAMRDSSSPPRARMGPLFSAGRAWARQGAQYEDTTGIDSEHAVPVPPGHPGTPVPRDQAKCQRAPFQTLLWSKSHSHRALRLDRRVRDGQVCPRASLEGSVGWTWAPFSVRDDTCLFLGTAAALLRGGPGDTGTDAELATPRAPSKHPCAARGLKTGVSPGGVIF